MNYNKTETEKTIIKTLEDTLHYIKNEQLEDYTVMVFFEAKEQYPTTPDETINLFSCSGTNLASTLTNLTMIKKNLEAKAYEMFVTTYLNTN